MFHDIMGLDEDFLPKHARRYADLAAAIRTAAGQYLEEVKAGSFPAAEHSVDLETLLEEGGAEREKGHG